MGANYLPALHIVAPLTERLYFGFGVTVPFGYFTDYGENALSSNYATKSKIETINFNPSLAFKVTDKFSVGLGFDAQYLKAEYNRNFYAMGVPIAPGFSADLNTKLFNTATDWAYGWNAGLFYQFDDATRVGLSYRSAMTHNATGDTKWQGSGTLTTPFGAINGSGSLSWDLSTQVNLPDMVLLSGYHDFNEHLAAMATVGYTHWSRFDNLTMNLKKGLPILPSSIKIKENFHDTFRYSIGGNYKFNEHWMWRVGAAYDKSPVDDANRTVPLPDGNRVWLSTGLQYAFNHHVSVDAGYAHLFICNGTVDNIDPISGHIRGHYDHNYANLIGGQLNIKFG